MLFAVPINYYKLDLFRFFRARPGSTSSVTGSSIPTAGLKASASHITLPTRSLAASFGAFPQKLSAKINKSRNISCVRVFVRRVHIGDRVVPIGGIGEVSTNPDFRGQGLATRVMQDAEAVMVHNGCVHAMLPSSYLTYNSIMLSSLHASVEATTALYRRLGWQSVPVESRVGVLAEEFPLSGGHHRALAIAMP